EAGQVGVVVAAMCLAEGAQAGVAEAGAEEGAVGRGLRPAEAVEVDEADGAVLADQHLRGAEAAVRGHRRLLAGRRDPAIEPVQQAGYRPVEGRYERCEPLDDAA